MILSEKGLCGAMPVCLGGMICSTPVPLGLYKVIYRLIK